MTEEQEKKEAKRLKRKGNFLFLLSMAAFFVGLGILPLGVLFIPLGIVLLIAAIAMWGRADTFRPEKVQPVVPPVYRKPQYNSKGILKNPAQVHPDTLPQVEFEFASEFLLDEQTGEIIERPVKRIKMPSFDAAKPGGVHFE